MSDSPRRPRSAGPHRQQGRNAPSGQTSRRKSVDDFVKKSNDLLSRTKYYYSPFKGFYDVVKGIYKMAQDLRDLSAFILSFFAVSVAVPSAVSSKASFGFLTPILQQFPIRFILYSVFAAALGWSLAALASLFYGRLNDWGDVISHFVAVVWAAILVGLATGFFDNSSGSYSLVFDVLTALGICVAVLFVRTHYQSTGAGEVRSMQLKSNVLAMFTMSCIAFAIITRLVE